jgi:hypothetical protein
MRWSGAFPPAVVASFLTETAVVKRINSGDDPDSRTTIIAAWRCTQPQWLDQQQKERAGLGTLARAALVKCAYPSATVKVRDRFIIGGVDYRIAAPPQAVPIAEPSHYLVYLEAEG